MRAAIYARRSTDEHQVSSLDVQVEEARRFVQARGWTIDPPHVYLEDAVSRAEFKKRPALLRMINAAEAGEFEVVVTRDETRIGGDMLRTGLVVSNLIDAGIKLYFYFESREVTLDNATDKFLMAAKNFASELEREKISQRTFEHLMTKARRGKNVGGRCYGYDNQRDVDGVGYVINETQAEVVREIFSRYADGQGLRTIAKALNARRLPSPRAGKKGTGSWSVGVIQPMLRRERYLGRFIWGQRQKTYKGGTKVRVARDECDWTVVELPHLRIVSDELWQAAHARIRHVEKTDGKEKVSGRKPKYMLSQLGRCSSCGGPIKVSNGKHGKTGIAPILWTVVSCDQAAIAARVTRSCSTGDA